MKMSTSMWMGVVLVSSTIALSVPAAFSNETGKGDHDRSAWNHHCGHGDMLNWKERFEARKTALHDKLKLTAEQEPAWTTFAGKIQPPAMQPQNWKELAQMSAPDRMQAMLDRIKARVASMSSNLDAVKEFYAVLTADQQKVFDGEFMAHGHHHHMQPESNKP